MTMRVVFCAFSLLLHAILLEATDDAATKRPNIIVILADDLGWNDVSFHGSQQIPTPNLDKLAHDGILLNNYYVSPICTPTRGALLTGRHPMQLGLQSDVIVGPEPWGLGINETILPQYLKHLGYSTHIVGKRSVILGDSPWGLGINETVLPQYLKDLGYKTHVVGKWHLGFFAKELTPLYRGFDSFYGYYLGAEDYIDHTGWAEAGYYGFDFRDGIDLDRSANGSYSTELFATRAEKIIANHDTNKPLFLYLPFQAVHSGNPWSTGSNPLEAPKKYTDKFPYITDPNRRIFAGMVSALDDAVGNITSALDAKGLLDNSLIIFSTDNGGPANGFDMNHACNWPLRGLKATYWEGGMRATGFVWSRLLKKRRRVSNQMIHVTDWLPTIMHIAGGNTTYNKSELYGMNMWETLSEDLPSPRDEIIHNYDKKSGAIRQGEWKVIKLGHGDHYSTNWPGWYKPESIDVTTLNLTVKCAERDSSLPNCTIETSPCLFNVIEDPCEFNNVAAKYPHIVRKMVKRLMEYASKSQHPRNCPTQKVAAPVYHGHAWVPWIELPPGATDDRQCDPKQADDVTD